MNVIPRALKTYERIILYAIFIVQNDPPCDKLRHVFLHLVLNCIFVERFIEV
jgi:hypothetical protein